MKNVLDGLLFSDNTFSFEELMEKDGSVST